MNGHFILCGLGRIGTRVLSFLRETGAKVVVIDSRDPNPEALKAGKFIRGDCRQQAVLEEAGIATAKGVLILTSEDLVNLSCTLMARKLNPEIRIIARMFNQELISRLGSAARNVTAMSTSALAAPLLAIIGKTGGALGGFSLPDNTRLHVAEQLIRATSPVRGQTLSRAISLHDILIVGHCPKGKQYQFLNQMYQDEELQPGDRIIVVGEPVQIPGLRSDKADLSSIPLLASFVRRYTRVLFRTISGINLPVKICTALLLLVVIGSTLVFHLTMNLSVPDGLYRTISVMATMADMGSKELEPNGWQKVFLSLLRLSGAALIAAFTAILTNYLVRAQLKGALEIRRIPEKGHFVICGLGNVGFRLVQELLRDGEKVVVIEMASENSFARTARRQGAAVLEGDATVPEVLKEAKITHARAVIVATNDDLVNLKIALLARELNAEQRVVVRLADSSLAQILREEADIRLALSIPDLAAPAFVAALFGDRVHSVFYVEGRMLAVVDIVARSGDIHLHDQPVRALAIDYNLQPVCLRNAEGEIRERPLNGRLEEGGCLTAIVDLLDLQRLLQRGQLPQKYGVVVERFPLPARGFVMQLLRTYLQLSAEEAEEKIDQLPCRIAGKLTQGNAEDLLYWLHREKVSAHLVEEKEEIPVSVN